MRLLYLHQYFVAPHEPGGTRSYELARRAAAAGHDVHLITTDRSPGARATWTQARLDGITIHRYGIPYSNRMSYARRLWSFLAFAVVAGPYAARLGGEVVVASSTPLTIAIPGRWAAWRCRCPFVLEIRDLWPEAPIAMGALRSPLLQRLAHALEHWAYRGARQVIALSPPMAEGVRHVAGAALPITVVPNAADVDTFRLPAAVGQQLRRTHPWLGSRPMLLYGGTLGAVNHVSWLATCAKHLATIWPEACLVVLGDGSARGALEATSRADGTWETTLHVLPPVPKAAMPAWLSAADGVVCSIAPDPRLWKASQNKFFDAYAAGRALILNHGGWQADEILRHEAGICLPSHLTVDDVRGLRQAMEAPSWPARHAAAARLGDGPYHRDHLAAIWLTAVTGAVA